VRVFLAGGSGVLGIRLVPLLVADGHEVAAMTRSEAKAPLVSSLGAKPVVCDVYDADRLEKLVVSFSPEAVMHQLTDLPDEASRIGEYAEANRRARSEATANLLRAALAAGASRFVAQSVAWELPGEAGETIRAHERAVLDAGGVVVRYGQLYGPGTYHDLAKPPPPRVHVDEAARQTVGTLRAGPGTIVVVTEMLETE
jgi:nucleoside-diphosphate-sugar epimerase